MGFDVSDIVGCLLTRDVSDIVVCRLDTVLGQVVDLLVGSLAVSRPWPYVPGTDWAKKRSVSDTVQCLQHCDLSSTLYSVSETVIGRLGK